MRARHKPPVTVALVRPHTGKTRSYRVTLCDHGKALADLILSESELRMLQRKVAKALTEHQR